LKLDWSLRKRLEERKEVHELRYSNKELGESEDLGFIKMGRRRKL